MRLAARIARATAAGMPERRAGVAAQARAQHRVRAAGRRARAHVAGPTTPSAVRPWRALEARDRARRCPGRRRRRRRCRGGAGAGGRSAPRRCATLRRRRRAGARARRCRLRRSMRHVPAPTTPSACMWWRRWKRLTARACRGRRRRRAAGAAARWSLATERPRSPWCSVGSGLRVGDGSSAHGRGGGAGSGRGRLDGASVGRLRGELTGSRDALRRGHAAIRPSGPPRRRPQWFPRSPTLCGQATRRGGRRRYQPKSLLIAGFLQALRPGAAARSPTSIPFCSMFIRSG